MERPTPTIEDYLGVIYALDREGETVIGRKLAEWLEVSPPTVTVTVQRMVRDGWVTMSKDKSVHLTSAGREMAASVVRRHMLTELLLAKVLNIPWSRVHDEADRLEHGISAEAAAAVESMVEDSRLCPHGNPLPGNESLTEYLVPLLDAAPGHTYVLARVREEVETNPELMAYLEAHCLVPGSQVVVLQTLPFNETVTVRAADATAVLGYAVARSLWLGEPHAPAYGTGGAGAPEDSMR
jgi:DtxR family Mn-dependent transcriptional regulator